jgi:hypothetical protein
MRLMAAVALALVFAPAGAAALEARLAIEPRSQFIGRPATISLFPLWPFLRDDGSCCRYEPADVRYPWRLQLLGPGERQIEVRPRRVARYRYAARVMFPVRGRWEIRVSNGYASTRDKRLTIRYHGPRLRVTIR